MLKCARKFHFCSGHRVLGHESKCAHPHGHNYTVFVEALATGCDADKLDDIGRVVDFSVLKEKIGTWIEDNWDHGFLLHPKDSELKAALNMVSGSKVFVMPYNPTAENMARFLLNVVCPTVLQATGVRATRVTVWETANCYAVATIG